MRALTVRPGTSGSALVGDLPEPAEADGSVLVQAAAGGGGGAPPGIALRGVAAAGERAVGGGRRARWGPGTALITGAGPVGLLAALLGRQRGLDVHVLDQVTDGPKPALVRDLGATYHSGSVLDTKLAPDVVIEATGVAQVVFDA